MSLLELGRQYYQTKSALSETIAIGDCSPNSFAIVGLFNLRSLNASVHNSEHIFPTNRLSIPSVHEEGGARWAGEVRPLQ